MAWAKPYVDEALAEVARGEEISLEEHKARDAARLAAFRQWRASSLHPWRTLIRRKSLPILASRQGRPIQRFLW